MADLPRRSRQGGFTLLEMIAAVGILVGGLTALISLLTVAVSTRAGADARQHAVWLADRVFAELAHEPLGSPWLEEDDPKVADHEPQSVDGMPGMRYSVHFVRSEQRPDVVIAEVKVAWSEQGEGQVQIFRRLLPRQDPFSRRAYHRLLDAGLDPSRQ